MVFNTDYQPAPLSKNIYELIYDFMRSHEPDQAKELPGFLESRMAKEELNRAILNRLGFALIDREEKPAWGLEWLKLNVILFPEDGNLWDSLGEAYLKYDQEEKAMNSFKKAMQLGNTVENCYWCTNTQEKMELINNRFASSHYLLSEDIPSDSAIIFAKGIISTNSYEFNITFSPDMQEIFFTRRKPGEDNAIYSMNFVDGAWSNPEPAFFTADEGWDFEPHITPDGDRLYFGSTRPLADTLYSRGLYQWYSEKTENGWSRPVPLEHPFKDRFVMYLTSSQNGNLYFTSLEKGDKIEDGAIYQSITENGAFTGAKRMDENINFSGSWIAHPYIAPDESYIIYDGEKDSGFGENDLYISFNMNGTWSEAHNMGPAINTELTEMCASVSPDGKYLFFHRGNNETGNIYWINFKPIKERILKQIQDR